MTGSTENGMQWPPSSARLTAQIHPAVAAKGLLLYTEIDSSSKTWAVSYSDAWWYWVASSAARHSASCP